MVEATLQKRISKQGKKSYSTYAITLPKSIIEADPKLSKSHKLKITLENGKIILSPV